MNSEKAKAPPYVAKIADGVPKRQPIENVHLQVYRICGRIDD
jgi:hypothetical protein